MNKLQKKIHFAYRYFTAHKRTTPDFLIIGAQKSGTTSLHYYLSQHPQLYMPPTKELHYFDVNFHRSDRHYHKYFMLEEDLRKKRREHGVFLQGESSPFYIMHPWAPQRAKLYNPDFKIIAILRDPIKRAISHYKHNVARGREKLSFTEAIRTEKERVAKDKEKLMKNPSSKAYKYRNFSYLERGLYEKQLNRWREHFDENQIHILHFEEFIKDIGHSLDRIYSFLGVKSIPSYHLNLEKRNEGKLPELHVDNEDINYLTEYYKSNSK